MSLSLGEYELQITWMYIFLQGRYRIVSLKGGYRFIEQDGQPEETHFINMILSTADGSRTFGGPVADLLIAGTKIQVSLFYKA